MKITFDWNCLIEVEEGREQAAFVSALIEAHRKGAVEVGLLAVSASENLKSKKFPGAAKLFRQRVNDLGWSDIPIVLAPSVHGMTFIGLTFIVGDADKFKADVQALWAVIAPNIPRRHSDYLQAGQRVSDEIFWSENSSKWRNAWCDVYSAYSHIKAKRDVFVTLNTRDFQKNADKLAKLGMMQICDPKDALRILDSP